MNDRVKEKLKNDEAPPPVFGSWRKLYFLVFAFLIANILFFYFLTKVFE